MQVSTDGVTEDMRQGLTSPRQVMIDTRGSAASEAA